MSFEHRQVVSLARRCSRHEVREIYPNKYITGDDRIYVFYTLFNLPGTSFTRVNRRGERRVVLPLEIYLIACLIDYFSTVATYVEYVDRSMGDVLVHNRYVQRSNSGSIRPKYSLVSCDFQRCAQLH